MYILLQIEPFLHIFHPYFTTIQSWHLCTYMYVSVGVCVCGMHVWCACTCVFCDYVIVYCCMLLLTCCFPIAAAYTYYRSLNQEASLRRRGKQDDRRRVRRRRERMLRVCFGSQFLFIDLYSLSKLLFLAFFVLTETSRKTGNAEEMQDG